MADEHDPTTSGSLVAGSGQHHAGGRSDFLVYFGAHYRLCPVEVREVWARALAGEEGLARVARMLGSEAVVISTCNRFDVCAWGAHSDDDLRTLFARLAEEFLKGNGEWNKTWEAQLQPKRLSGCLRFAHDLEAARLLFRVSASLDSLVLGEPHILGQVKEAFARARRPGHGLSALTPFFARAFHAAKRVRAETDLGKNGVSIGHAAVEITRRVYETLADHRVLVVGAGEMARIVAQHFLACGATRLAVANRTRDRAARLAEEVSRPGSTLSVQDFETSLDALGEVDIVVVATSATAHILHRARVEKSLRRRDGRPLVVVDISVPRNVAPDLASLDNVFVFDVDDLDKIMEHNRHSRREAARRAEAIIDQELDAFSHERRQRESLKAVGRFHAWARNAALYELTRKSRHTAGLGREGAEIIAEALAKRLVTHAATLAREGIPLPPLENVGDALESIFRLDELKDIPVGLSPEGSVSSDAHVDVNGDVNGDARVIPMRKEIKR
jgi:glutamyl-tRNA reductase